MRRLLGPTTGRRWARRLGIRNFSTRRLTVAEINVLIGTAYFADLMRQFGSEHAALAAYNAGESRVVRWQRERPGLPRDEFIDDIPFPETQNYVRRILGTAEDYRRLYGAREKPAGPPRTTAEPAANPPAQAPAARTPAPAATGVISPGVAPWLGGVTGPVDENPLTLSTSLAPSGEYTIYLLVAPAGSLEAYYLWETRFTISAPAVSNRSITLTWDPPTTNSDGTPLTDLAGFKVYHGAATRHYTRSVNAGNVRSFALSDLSPGTHYFSVTAYDISGNESTFSNEVSKTIR